MPRSLQKPAQALLVDLVRLADQYLQPRDLTRFPVAGEEVDDCALAPVARRLDMQGVEQGPVLYGQRDDAGISARQQPLFILVGEGRCQVEEIGLSEGIVGAQPLGKLDRIDLQRRGIDDDRSERVIVASGVDEGGECPDNAAAGAVVDRPQRHELEELLPAFSGLAQDQDPRA